MAQSFFSSVVVLVLCCLTGENRCLAQTRAPPKTICTSQPTSCTCVHPNGSTIDLTSIASKEANLPKFFRVLGLDQWHYYYNPCFGFNIGGDGCMGVAACQEWYQQFHSIGFAQIDKVSFGEDSIGTYIYYQGAIDNFAINGRVTKVYLQCNTNEDAEPLLTVEGDTADQHIYIMTLRHHTACWTAGSKQSKTTGGLSIGTYMCIGFLVLLVLYFGIGVAFMRLHRKAEGKEIIPNYYLWAELPGLIKDGVDFLRERITGFSSRSDVKYDQM